MRLPRLEKTNKQTNKTQQLTSIIVRRFTRQLPFFLWNSHIMRNIYDVKIYSQIAIKNNWFNEFWNPYRLTSSYLSKRAVRTAFWWPLNSGNSDLTGAYFILTDKPISLIVKKAGHLGGRPHCPGLCRPTALTAQKLWTRRCCFQPPCCELCRLLSLLACRLCGLLPVNKASGEVESLGVLSVVFHNIVRRQKLNSLFQLLPLFCNSD